MQEVIAAITTDAVADACSPRPRPPAVLRTSGGAAIGTPPPSAAIFVGAVRDVDAAVVGDASCRRRPAAQVERRVVLRPLRPGDRRDDLGHVEMQRVGVDRVVVRRRATCRSPWHRPRPARSAPRRARSGAGSAASRRRSGRSRRWRRTPAPCWRSSPGRPAAGGRARRRRTRRTCSTTPFLRSICTTLSTRSVAVVPSTIRPVSLKPTTSGISIETGWPSIAASASMPPTPQPSTARPFTIVVWLSVPTSVSG